MKLGVSLHTNRLTESDFDMTSKFQDMHRFAVEVMNVVDYNTVR